MTKTSILEVKLVEPNQKNPKDLSSPLSKNNYEDPNLHHAYPYNHQIPRPSSPQVAYILMHNPLRALEQTDPMKNEVI